LAGCHCEGLAPAHETGHVQVQKTVQGWHLFPEDYRIYEDWSGIDKSRERYNRIKDGLVSEGEVQEMNNKKNFYDEEPYEEHVCSFFLAYHQVVAYQRWLLFCPANLEHFCEFEKSFLVIVM
jgi:hypothetical protein